MNHSIAGYVGLDAQGFSPEKGRERKTIENSLWRAWRLRGKEQARFRQANVIVQAVLFF